MMHEKRDTPLDEMLDVVVGDVRQLLWNRQIWDKTRPLLVAQAEVEPHGVFIRWLADIYASSQAVRIRRQTDRDARSISIARFLLRLSEDPRSISRDEHVSAYSSSSIAEQFGEDVAAEIANREFDNFVAPGADYFDPAIAQQDLEHLENVTDVVRHYVNKSIAHPDAEGPTEVPSFNDVERCIDLLQELCKKYLLITQRVSDSISATPQMDWMAIFRAPWI
jgi:hypothetical protein